MLLTTASQIPMQCEDTVFRVLYIFRSSLTQYHLRSTTWSSKPAVASSRLTIFTPYCHSSNQSLLRSESLLTERAHIWNHRHAPVSTITHVNWSSHFQVCETLNRVWNKSEHRNISKDDASPEHPLVQQLHLLYHLVHGEQTSCTLLSTNQTEGDQWELNCITATMFTML